MRPVGQFALLPLAVSGMSLLLLKPGLSTWIVDQGRPAWRGLGVPVGGAADRRSLAIGNALVGNPPYAAALEIALGGPTLRAEAAVAGVLYGAPFELASGRQELQAGVTFSLSEGEEVHIGGALAGMRAYLCVRGGFETPVTLGSRSSLVPLECGTRLACQAGSIGRRYVGIPSLPHGAPHTVRVVAGPQAGWFETPLAGPYRVEPASNRMGLRLRGSALLHRSSGNSQRELVSEPVCPGAVQVTNDGGLIVLGVEGQTIGGYPKIAHVISADLDLLGQVRPGEEVFFERVTLEEAEGLFRQRQAELAAWVTRLRAGLGG